MLKIPVTEAIGTELCHDITKVVPGREQYPAFRRGHVLTANDVSQLKDLGKENVYVWEEKADFIHEEEAGLRLARHACGPGLSWTVPRQGRVNIKADYDGLFKVNTETLYALNSIDDVILATLHNNRVVRKNQMVAGTRVIPLTIQRSLLEKAEELCIKNSPLLSIKTFHSFWVGIVSTGNEVYSGQIKDSFRTVIQQKIAPFGGKVLGQVFVPDDSERITLEIQQMIGQGAEIIMVTGGMSVDADDLTPSGIRNTGAEVVFYGAPVMPGSQFMLAYLGHVPICGVPGGALYARSTTFDLILPRIFAGEKIEKAEIASLGHGGLCLECEVCRYPECPFGKTI